MQSFDHEKLQVYQKALEFIESLNPLFRSMRENGQYSLSVRKHLDESSTSIPLNIAEGNGKYRPADRCRYFDIARGSALECASCLDVLVAKQILNAEEVLPGKKKLHGIVSMLYGLIRSNSDRFYDIGSEYTLDEEIPE